MAGWPVTLSPIVEGLVTPLSPRTSIGPPTVGHWQVIRAGLPLDRLFLPRSQLWLDMSRHLVQTACMKSLSKAELDALLAVAQRHSEADCLMLLVTVCHALRVSETLALTKDNIVDSHLVVQRLKGSRRTTQPLLPAERDGLLELARTVEGRLFKMSRETFWRRMKTYGAEAGIPEHRLFPHALKHSAGRLGYLAGMGVPELVAYLGHKNPANSLIYAQAGEQEAAAAFAAAFGGVGTAATAAAVGVGA